MGTIVFIVEDNEDIGYILDFYLSDEGYKVSVFSNITAFKAALTLNKPDIFILDVMLPDGNGIDLCNELKSDPESRDLPVLMMSANTTAEKVTDSTRADGFIKKPFDLLAVQQALYNTLLDR
ncbi:Response regulator receiver domain-containing protein [Pedobacter westerhofensis]|uniref:Response regulator receiver domain-containing protein n=1 Tax=Pedobacter westerhofensis TaxID=425512 RepID=A0A521FS18_9SPHI|nr:response regulator [Pedobacter westerhofensis]SMO99027.1 Response regulator receiver domain-containing protein [Pedobacter westerhofensis]